MVKLVSGKEGGDLFGMEMKAKYQINCNFMVVSEADCETGKHGKPFTQ